MRQWFCCPVIQAGGHQQCTVRSSGTLETRLTLPGRRNSRLLEFRSDPLAQKTG
ncbi:MAG: hypothetical protein FD165_2075 [Gammaproteobacteria bacterium]|nr:MAG: hypothetical protein FD165_2075 [Gammaproteobacteria bacterium]TND03476.1 MAG: hypothetical protein FD120_1871 [Gammaproteobacteria bacterium]